MSVHVIDIGRTFPQEFARRKPSRKHAKNAARHYGTINANTAGQNTGGKQKMKKLITLLVFWQTLNVSAYCHTGNPTASGVWPHVGMAAADHLPFGAKVTLPDGRILIITDRFGGGYRDRLDIFMTSEAECWKFGRQILRCKVEVEE